MEVKKIGMPIPQKDEKLILVLIIGALEALQEGALSLCEVEKIIFAPYYSRLLQEMSCSSSVLEIIDKGCELEDIESLFPNNLEKTISELKNETIQLLQKYPEYPKKNWIKSIE